MKNIAMIIAGGVGARVGAKVPKQYIKVLGKPVIAYTMEAFENHKDIDAITIVCQPEYEQDIRDIASEYGITKLSYVFHGGKEGQDSIRNGVYGLYEHYDREDLILIHDAIRPLVDEAVLDDCIRVARDNGNAIVCIPCVTTMMQKEREIVDGKEVGLESSVEVYPRDFIMETQTPQAFDLGTLWDCHHKAVEQGITGMTASCQLMPTLGVRVFFSKGSEKNIKITVEDDLDLMEAILKSGKGSWRDEN